MEKPAESCRKHSPFCSKQSGPAEDCHICASILKAETQAAITEKDLFEYLSLVGLRDFQEVASACFNWCRINFTPRKMETQDAVADVANAAFKRIAEMQAKIEALEKERDEADSNAKLWSEQVAELKYLIDDWKIEEKAWKETEAARLKEIAEARHLLERIYIRYLQPGTEFDKPVLDFLAKTKPAETT